MYAKDNEVPELACKRKNHGMTYALLLFPFPYLKGVVFHLGAMFVKR
jgi:hypothetical protein